MPLLPRSAICDPELTLGLPPGLTAATGMDAIAHCMETFMAAAFNPPADGIALDGLERGWAHIERATRDGVGYRGIGVERQVRSVLLARAEREQH